MQKARHVVTIDVKDVCEALQRSEMSTTKPEKMWLRHSKVRQQVS